MVLRKSKSNESERGASLVEYAILMALICVACIFAVRSFGVELSLHIQDSTEKLAAAGTVN